MTTPPTPQDVRDLIADEFARFLREEGARDRPWDFADGLAAIVEPVIRQQVAEEIARHIEHPIGPQEVRWAPIARRWMAESAAIARSHSTREGQDHG